VPSDSGGTPHFSRKRENPNEGKGLAARVLLHLGKQARLGPNDLAQIESTQEGMASALGVWQGSLVRVLQRLKAGGGVSVERRFVAGANRRMKVYALTEIGKSAAYDLRHRDLSDPPPPIEGVEGRTPS
jgi:DNA-binding PadR family transcriptional regulator